MSVCKHVEQHGQPSSRVVELENDQGKEIVVNGRGWRDRCALRMQTAGAKPEDMKTASGSSKQIGKLHVVDPSDLWLSTALSQVW